MRTGGGPLMFLFDDITSTNFLVDTGASRSVLPFYSKFKASGPQLFAADGARIATWGQRRIKLSFGGHDFAYSLIWLLLINLF
jgi:hypothetical protein